MYIHYDTYIDHLLYMRWAKCLIVCAWPPNNNKKDLGCIHRPMRSRVLDHYGHQDTSPRA